jgi:hypothetical protein
MSHAPETPGTGCDRPTLSRRTALAALAGGMLSVGGPPPLRKIRPMTGDIVMVDGWMLRTSDLEEVPGVAYRC